MFYFVIFPLSIHVLRFDLLSLVFFRRIQKSHVSTNLVHKLYRIQNIAGKLIPYFEKLVSKENLATIEAKQKSEYRMWFTLTIEARNGVLYQVCLPFFSRVFIFIQHLFWYYVSSFYFDLHFEFMLS
jgi:hypothetical protein